MSQISIKSSLRSTRALEPQEITFFFGLQKELLEKTPFGEGSELAASWNEAIRLSNGLSGRCLRKIPLLAYIEGQTSMAAFMESFLKLIKAKAAEKKLAQSHHMFQSISLV